MAQPSPQRGSGPLGHAAVPGGRSCAWEPGLWAQRLPRSNVVPQARALRIRAEVTLRTRSSSLRWLS